jgi:hypothetical protein
MLYNNFYYIWNCVCYNIIKLTSGAVARNCTKFGHCLEVLVITGRIIMKRVLKFEISWRRLKETMG